MHPLDCAIWNALTTKHAQFSAGVDLAKRYAPDIGPLAGFKDHSPAAIAALAALIAPGEDLSLLEPNPPAPPPGLTLALNARCLQMVWTKFSVGAPDPSIEVLTEADAPDMLALATQTRPGPYRARTHALGRFFGIREKGQLVAMAGERMHVAGFHEVSAVCTHPAYRGRGFGAALMRAVGLRIVNEGDAPFLHAYVDNAPALALYRSLGFEPRAEVTHAVWRRG